MNKKLAGLSLAALGVVYGDIGTSPLYTMHEIFTAQPFQLNQFNILGILSLIFWSLILVVSFKYISYIMKADNRGEGGIMALLSLANSKESSSNKRNLIITLGILGASMFFADGMITPAISVLSAVEGIQVAAPQFQSWVIPATIVIILILFWVQSKGTHTVGAFFGPVMLIWFLTLAGLGILNIIKNPSVALALNPYYAFSFFAAAPLAAFIGLGSIVLCVTGAEALYADMGHFGRQPIKLAWFIVAFPSLVLNYYCLLYTSPSPRD